MRLGTRDPDVARRDDASVALVLDLPGEKGITLGLHAAHRGFRLVPLYNALPPSPGGVPAVCDVQSIIAALAVATPALETLNLPFDAPPVFLLDATRRYGTLHAPTPGAFDNRSVSLVTDFPSANRMLASGIRRVVLVQRDRTGPQEDLAHTPLRWQQAGIAIESATIEPPTQASAIRVSRPSLYRAVWQRLFLAIGLRRSPLGGFGGTLPIPSTSGGLG